ncbi:MAG: PSD1 and planctomycete cytochrome C domain-containing protein [Pirellulaceae bacterium]
MINRKFLSLRNDYYRTLGLGLLIFVCTVPASHAAETGEQAERMEFFERKIRPVLTTHCLECHGPEKQHNGLRLDLREHLLRGGDGGPAVNLDDPDSSPLLQALRHETVEMPPDEKLPETVIADFRKWIAAGAVDPREAENPDLPISELAESHWSFQPLAEISPPATEATFPARSPVDHFLQATREAVGVKPVEAADRHTLIRRATWDLIGLPPTPDEVASFVSDDSPQAYERLIDRLLASPHYGERWGRHWLDVVRYADTAGETSDFPAPEAWRYRNYVIEAFNRDKPYDEFIREQIAGDILAQEEVADVSPERYAELITATGYLAISRRFGFDISKDHYLTIEDTIDTLGKSVLGLTIACARCHDHKYDPISAADYYALYGIFESTRFAFPGCEHDKRPRDLVPLVTAEQGERQLVPHTETLRAANERVARHQAEVQRLREILAEASSSEGEELLAGAIPNGGEERFPDQAEPRTVQRGDMLQLSILPNANHGADTTLVELEIRQVGGEGRIWNLTADLLGSFRETCDPGPWRVFDLQAGLTPFSRMIPDALNTEGLQLWHGAADLPSLALNSLDREIRFLTVTLPPRQVSLHPGPSGGVAVAWASPIEGQVTIRGRVANVDDSSGDGIVWSVAHRSGFGEQLQDVRGELLALESAQNEQAKLAAEAPAVPVAYGVTEGSPGHAQIHMRGDPQKLGAEVPRRFLELLGGEKVSPAESGSGRKQLAEWLTDPDNPLTARVLVNRIWQHHFGRGLVKTPNDFGLRGQPPTHPELLDWLAAELVNSGWSIKHMHRRIMLSAAYRQSSGSSSQASTIDPENQWYWRFERRRLDAEQIRDGMLAVSGRLDRSPGESHPFPPADQWSFTQHGPFAAVYETNRRSVYLMVQRISRHPFLGLFDGADPNTSTAARVNSTVPPQALYFLNAPFVHDQAAALADRLRQHSQDPRERTDQACRLLYGRPAEEADHQDAEQFFEAYLAELGSLDPAQRAIEAERAYARILLSSSEFLYVE